jgi:hypothetical protein
MEAKSALFLKYFTLFMNLLNDCSEAGNEEKESGARGKHSNAIQVPILPNLHVLGYKYL